MKQYIFDSLDSAKKLYAFGWLYGEKSNNGKIIVNATRSSYRCTQFVKHVLGIYSKSKLIEFASENIINKLNAVTFDLLIANPFFNSFCMGVLDKYGILSEGIDSKFVLNNYKIENGVPSICMLISEYFNMNCIECYEFAVITGTSIIDSLCPIYFESGLKFTSPMKKYLTSFTGGETMIDIVLEKEAIMPTKAHYTDAGLDISIISEYKRIDEYTCLYDTGIRVSPPLGFWSAIFPRSSISKSGFMVHNSVGVVDVSYRGTMLIALTKVNPYAEITFPFKCAQLILIPQVFTSCRQVKSLDNTSRGVGGYGSSG